MEFLRRALRILNKVLTSEKVDTEFEGFLHCSMPIFIPAFSNEALRTLRIRAVCKSHISNPAGIKRVANCLYNRCQVKNC